ncbi:MAG TPA: class I SAM-dependent methyltransferase [Herpetosiphonaceae bacterium]|nr:class I SAM-dependent methyltransferase [Herpetosiphonaceae bacterium]
MNWIGLAAQAWDPSGGDTLQADAAAIRAIIDSNPGPALDVGCGTGRLLLRYLADGLEVDGVDTSADMLRLCREKGASQGLTPLLCQQAMQELALPRTYRTIFVPCGSFCLVTDRGQAFEALRRFYRHLDAGGCLVFNLFWPFAPGEPLSAQPNGAGGEWTEWDTSTLPDGRQIVQHLRMTGLDRAEQLLCAERRYRLIEDGRIVQEEVFAANERWYFKHEVVLMLESVGFQAIQVKGNWTADDFAEPHYSMVFIAHKQ